MHAFVTVGSTRFDDLVRQALSPAVLDALRTKKYTTVAVQCGNSDFETAGYTQQGDVWTRELGDGASVEVWRFKPSLKEEYERADLVISHAGAGLATPAFAKLTSGRVGDYPGCPASEQTAHRRAELDAHGRPPARACDCPDQPGARQGLDGFVSPAFGIISCAVWLTRTAQGTGASYL